jgi:hypothetical protein
MMGAANPATTSGSQSDFACSTSMLHRPDSDDGSRFTEQTLALEKLAPTTLALMTWSAIQAVLNLQATCRLVVMNVGNRIVSPRFGQRTQNEALAWVIRNKEPSRTTFAIANRKQEAAN